MALGLGSNFVIASNLSYVSFSLCFVFSRTASDLDRRRTRTSKIYRENPSKLLSMATSSLFHLSAPPSLAIDSSKSSFLCGTQLPLPSSRLRTSCRRYVLSPSAQQSMDHIPKQFRGENLKDGCKFSIIAEVVYLIPFVFFWMWFID